MCSFGGQRCAVAIAAKIGRIVVVLGFQFVNVNLAFVARLRFQSAITAQKLFVVILANRVVFTMRAGFTVAHVHLGRFICPQKAEPVVVGRSDWYCCFHFAVSWFAVSWGYGRTSL